MFVVSSRFLIDTLNLSKFNSIPKLLRFLPTLLLLFSCSIASDSLWPHGLQHARLSCSSLSPRVCSNSCPLSQWCHPAIISSVILFSSCLLSVSVSGSFLISWLFWSQSQSIGASASLLPKNIQRWFPSGWFDLLANQGTLKSLQQHSWKASALSLL